MSAKTINIIYWIATGLLSLMMCFSAGLYIFNSEVMSEVFVGLGFPAWLLYPLAAAKILGLIAIWTNKSSTLKEWAYAGYFFDFALAATAHIMINDGEFGGAVMAMVLLLTSYFFGHKKAAAASKS